MGIFNKNEGSEKLSKSEKLLNQYGLSDLSDDRRGLHRLYLWKQISADEYPHLRMGSGASGAFPCGEGKAVLPG